MNTEINPVIWFEIPVADMERSKAFYEAVFDRKLTIVDLGPRQMAMFPMEMNVPGIGGALVKEEHFVPSYTGTLIYFSVTDIPGTLNKVVAHKGKELIPMTSIGEYGFCAYFEDSEGNRIGLHTM
ncbi:Glyoxalase-like domain protein [Sporomusa ovata DSM 2662]|uniref:Glyoxalase family protein n=1 Tax=Sporomusa ovata TaxID=2378 RepID=A0A0U1L6S1_9FIRM|nr:VOC family protein [Sporomusa ovata]EQB24632.1 putative glyoxalase [Sporomusa ovata DSM 2662]CQR74979.1 Glyoxalase family protein [Sporomusa ovata]